MCCTLAPDIRKGLSISDTVLSCCFTGCVELHGQPWDRLTKIVLSCCVAEGLKRSEQMTHCSLVLEDTFSDKRRFVCRDTVPELPRVPKSYSLSLIIIIKCRQHSHKRIPRFHINQQFTSTLTSWTDISPSQLTSAVSKATSTLESRQEQSNKSKESIPMSLPPTHRSPMGMYSCSSPTLSGCT